MGRFIAFYYLTLGIAWLQFSTFSFITPYSSFAIFLSHSRQYHLYFAHPHPLFPTLLPTYYLIHSFEHTLYLPTTSLPNQLLQSTMHSHKCIRT